MSPDDIAGVRVNAGASCTCGHHPFDHDLHASILTGDPAPCRKCNCPAFVHEPGTPPMLSLLDRRGHEIKP